AAASGEARSARRYLSCRRKAAEFWTSFMSEPVADAGGGARRALGAHAALALVAGRVAPGGRLALLVLGGPGLGLADLGRQLVLRADDIAGSHLGEQPQEEGGERVHGSSWLVGVSSSERNKARSGSAATARSSSSIS